MVGAEASQQLAHMLPHPAVTRSAAAAACWSWCLHATTCGTTSERWAGGACRTPQACCRCQQQCRCCPVLHGRWLPCTVATPLPAHFLPTRPAPPFVRQVTTASVACGVLGVGGNKGAVAVEFSVHRRKIAVVCSHFAAHQVRWLCRALRLGSVGWDGCMGATFMSTGEAIPCPRFCLPTHPSHPHTCWSHPLLPPAGCGGGA